MVELILYSNDTKGRNVIYYLFHTNKDKVQRIEGLFNKHFYVGNYKEINPDTDDTDTDCEYIYFALGSGIHELEYKEYSISVEINSVIDKDNNDRILPAGNDYKTEIMKEIKLNASSMNVFDSLIKDASKYYNGIIKMLENNKLNKIKKYIYDPEGYWDFMNTSDIRNIDSLFLKQNQKNTLMEYVTNFMKTETREDYLKFNIPYKCNILLYGVPGTGKTSTILTIASHIKTNIGVIPISREITDSKLVHAFNNVRKNDCKILVMEDIDCLFIDRKSNDTLKNSLTLSGILNCLDGLCRNEGIIVFLTTNRIDALDDALIRSSRIDYRIEYTYADEYQTRECFNYFFPQLKDNFSKFYDRISFKKYTIAMLQEFFFKFRKSQNIIDHLCELDFIIKANQNDALKGESTENLYI
jgi:SpoVK/Ycf46/Vps4 family AAA+-type ATPase